MANSRNVSLFDAATAGLGLCALYYGVKWLKNSVQILHAANKDEKSTGNQNIQKLSQGFAQVDHNDPSLEGARALVEGMAQGNKKFISAGRSVSLLYAAGGGLMLFGAYKAGNSLSTGQPMGNVATIAGAGAAIGVASTLVRKI